MAPPQVVLNSFAVTELLSTNGTGIGCMFCQMGGFMPFQFRSDDEFFAALCTGETLAIVSDHLVIYHRIVIRKFQLTKFAFGRLSTVTFHVLYQVASTQELLTAKVTDHETVFDMIGDMVVSVKQVQSNWVFLAEFLVAKLAGFVKFQFVNKNIFHRYSTNVTFVFSMSHIVENLHMSSQCTLISAPCVAHTAPHACLVYMSFQVLYYGLATAYLLPAVVTNVRTFRQMLITIVLSQFGIGDEFFVALFTWKTFETVSGHFVINHGIGIRKFQLTDSALARPLAVPLHVNYHVAAT
jgi:hypothetical protein